MCTQLSKMYSFAKSFFSCIKVDDMVPGSWCRGEATLDATHCHKHRRVAVVGSELMDCCVGHEPVLLHKQLVETVW
jgi:hypothetical protein